MTTTPGIPIVMRLTKKAGVRQAPIRPKGANKSGSANTFMFTHNYSFSFLR
jgi:hypothetical protein